MMVAERYQKAPERVHDLPLAAVESFNGALLMGPCNSLSPGFAAQLGKPAVAGSDAHVHYAVGSSFTTFPAGQPRPCARHYTAARSGRWATTGRRKPIS